MAFYVHLLLICLSFWVGKSFSDPRTTEVALICTNQSAAISDRQVFVPNFLAAMEALTSLISIQKYGGVVNGTGNNTVYAFGECMKDLSQTECNLCFARIKTQILRCLPFQRLIRGGRLFFDGCYVRYDDYMFFNESLSAVDRTVCGSNDYGGNHSVFGSNVVELVRNLSLEGPKNGGFSVASVNRGNVSVYGLAQCWDFVKKTACEECLANSIPNVDLCPPKGEGRVLNAGCYMRYSTQKFYYNSSSDASSGNGEFPNGQLVIWKHSISHHIGEIISGSKGQGPFMIEGRSNHLGVILASTFAAAAFVLILATIIFFVSKKILKQRREKKQFGALLNAVNKSKLNFSYETLEKATNYFHDSNKLGQGGSGSVYKGILPDGQAVAIKRLFFNTRQWVDHFFNEVNLISGIHHNNLVKLLGCSITGPESLLVYEYVPNQSLHDHLFGGRNAQPLNWRARCKILLGTANGLAYLHEESKLRIIHRDIKLSNILLEEDFTPKIADFGLARLFPRDESHISTVIAGTLGYMAPEYVIRGKLTEKADVYSFGVLVIEVVSGKRNNAISQASSSILQMIWDLYGRERLYDAIDPSLEGNIQKDEASRLLQIGLLCVQASAESRPLMSIVVKMLSDYNFEIPQPTQPPFLNSDSADQLQQLINPIMNNYQCDSQTHSSGNEITESWIEPR